MLEMTMVTAAERDLGQQRELLVDPTRARQARFARNADRYDPVATRRERSAGGSRAAPLVRAVRLRQQLS